MIFIALGANLPGRDRRPPKATLVQSLALLEGRGIRVLRRSRWYRSAPVPPAGQPDFVNAVAEIGTGLEPVPLLAEMQDVERRMGRVRGAPNAARTCDLDLIDYRGRVLDLPGEGGPPLVLPHPRMHERLFVLLPLAELAPGWTHPVSGVPVRSLVAAAPPGQDCTPLPDCGDGS